MIKICSKCKTEKHVSQFNMDKSRTDGRFPQCKECRSTYTVKYKQLNPEQRKQKAKEWRSRRDANIEARNKYLERSALYSLKSRYGITVQEVLEIANRQGGVCAICGRTPQKKKFGGLHIDHDHNTKRLEGYFAMSVIVV